MDYWRKWIPACAGKTELKYPLTLALFWSDQLSSGTGWASVQSAGGVRMLTRSHPFPGGERRGFKESEEFRARMSECTFGTIGNVR